MRIGEAAELLGVPTHVLRHWNDLGVVAPERATSGHRIYTEEDLQRLRIVLACRGVGMSLPEIRLVLRGRGVPERSEALRRHVVRLREQQSELRRAETFLVHVIDCQHALITTCPDCDAYASGAEAPEGSR